jgi:dienelactone hydrolase
MTSAGESQAGERVTFESHGEAIVGRLFRAAFDNGPGPAVAIIGPENYQKEQAPALYAPRFAELGYTALIFDPR